MIATLKLSITWSSCCESRIWWEYLLNYISNYIGIHNTKCRHTTVWLNLWRYHTNWDHARSLWCNIAAIWLFYVTKLSSLNYQWTSFMVFILIDSFNTSYFLYIYIYLFWTSEPWKQDGTHQSWIFRYANYFIPMRITSSVMHLWNLSTDWFESVLDYYESVE